MLKSSSFALGVLTSGVGYVALHLILDFTLWGLLPFAIIGVASIFALVVALLFFLWLHAYYVTPSNGG